MSAHRLSKSRFVAGVQCHKLLWWKVHEPGAVELQPGKVLQDRFDQGHAVGQLATALFSGGVLIDLPHDAVGERVEQTRRAIAGNAPAVFEASFLERNTFVAVDILERAPWSCPGLVDTSRLRERRCHYARAREAVPA